MIVHTDGSCYWKDGHMGTGIAFFGDEDYIPFREEAITILWLGTSNAAEYHAVIQALMIILKDYDLPNIHCIHIYTDSQLIYNQIIGEWLCIPESLKLLLAEVWRLIREIKKPLILFHWVSREDERQKQVDVLSKRANPYFQNDSRPIGKTVRIGKSYKTKKK
jgi:ribonuclease HI